MIRFTLSAWFAAFALVPARAETLQTCTTVSIPVQAGTSPPQPLALAIPSFSPQLGNLLAIDITVTVNAQHVIGIENLSAFPWSPYVTLNTNAVLIRPDASILTFSQATSQLAPTLPPYDGSTDFAGSSGVTQAFTPSTTTALTVAAGSADVALFLSGATIQPRLTIYTVGTQGPPWVQGGPNGSWTEFVTVLQGADVTVCYRYSTPGSVACSGDGTGAACPCGNIGASGHGCASSINVAGATLSASGNPASSADSFHLRADGLPLGAPALFFQGSSLLSGGAGIAFGDGLRCVGGQVVRLGTRTAMNGTVQLGPLFGDAPISVTGAIPAGGGSFAYQVWYRNAAAFCTPATFNLTNAWLALWTP
jgi:hypothetical protein